MEHDQAATQLERLTEFLYILPVGLMQFRMDGRVELINPLAVQLLLPLSPGSDLTDAFSALAPLLPGIVGLVRSFKERSGVLLDHAPCEIGLHGREMVISITIHRTPEGVNMAVLEDVTRLVAQERELLADRQRLQAIYAHVQDYAIFTVDLEGRFDKWNPSLLRFGGWSEAEVLGHPLDAFFPPEHQEAGGLRALLADARRTGSVQLEGSRIRADQGRAWASSVISALPDANGDVCGYLVISRDMTERRNMEDELRRLATTDPLTGAFNRRHGQTCIADASRRAARGGLQPAILMLNVDHFKAINDGHGHAVGDDVLRAVAGICRKALGEDVTLVRWGARSSSSCCPARPSSRPPISASRCGWRCKARASRCRGGRSPSRPASGWPPRGAKCRISW